MPSRSVGVYRGTIVLALNVDLECLWLVYAKRLTHAFSAPRHTKKPENTKPLPGAGALERNVRATQSVFFSFDQEIHLLSGCLGTSTLQGALV